MARFRAVTQAPVLAPSAIAQRFRERFGAPPRLFQAPGRINIIGEHTDYSGGLAMPAAIDRRCIVAAAANGTHCLDVVAHSLAREGTVDLGVLARTGTWLDYVTGVASILRGDGVNVPGADLWIESDVPVGAGVSSSAALEVGIAHALLALAGAVADGVQIARWAQAAENRFVGMPCGIMDQFASANGIAGAALLLNCSTLDFEAVKLPRGASFVLVDSAVRHTHVESAYRARRGDCELAARILDVPALGALSEASLADASRRLSGGPLKRCRHVVSENARVRRASAALAQDDLSGLGSLMNDSHASLRDDMEVSVPEVDRLVAIAQATRGVFGARMMGGGFGGCVIALARSDAADSALQAIRAAYAPASGGSPDGFVCHAVAGAGEIPS